MQDALNDSDAHQQQRTGLFLFSSGKNYSAWRAIKKPQQYPYNFDLCLNL